jgi:AcrR family transcriptional regulator
LEAIAKRAGVNRVTLYRRFSDREGLLAAWASREGAKMTQFLYETLEPYDNPRVRFAEGFIATVDYAQSHAYIRFAAAKDPATFVAAFRANQAGVLRIGARVLAEEIRGYQALGYVTHLDAELVGEAITRMAFAAVLVPGGLIDVRNAATIRAFAENTLAPMLFGDTR